MSENKMNEMKDKIAGSVKEAAGKVTDNEELEMKGKLQKGLGKAREVAGDVVDEMEDVKDTVFGTVKEYTGKYTDDEALELKGQFQKNKAKSEMTNKIICGAGALAGVLLIKGVAKRKRRRN